MPAYFSIETEFSRKDIYPCFMKDFYDALEMSGVSFAGGFAEDKDLPPGDIVSWNQRLIEDNFHLGYTEHRSHDYKQAMFHIDGFEYVRGFWMNNFPTDGEFNFSLIIPEYEVIQGGSEYMGNERFDRDKAEKLMRISERLWEIFPHILTIQTALEITGGTVPHNDIKYGRAPELYPFAVFSAEILPESISRNVYRHIGRNGVTVIDRNFTE